MITQELINYIREQINQGVSQDQIKVLLIKKGWQEKDVDEAFSLINSSSQDSVVSYYQSENQGTGKRKIFAILAVMLGVLLIVGVSFGYFYYFKKGEYPKTVFKKMLERLKDIKSSEEEGRLVFRVFTKEDEKKDSYGDSSEFNINLFFNFKLKEDVNDLNHPKGSSSVDFLFSIVSLLSPKQNIDLKLDSIYIDKKIYFKVSGNGVNYLLSKIGKSPQYVQKIVNQWIELDTKNPLNEYRSGKEEFETNSSLNKEILESLLKEILESLLDVFEITALPDQKLGNSKVYHYRLTIKEEELKKAMKEYYFWVEDDFDELLKEMISQVKGEVWIDKKNYFLHKIVFELPEVSLKDNYGGDQMVFYIESKLDIDIKNHNKPVKIEAPSSAKKIEEIIDLPSFPYNPNF